MVGLVYLLQLQVLLFFEVAVAVVEQIAVLVVLVELAAEVLERKTPQQQVAQ
jgi:hypothetical protein